ncbi:MAG: hypothetical protein K2G35_02145 [Duncaniella sp.]|nr:hypothetical protein [Duncaniella sp.]
MSTIAERIAEGASLAASTLKSVIKMALLSRHTASARADRGGRSLVVMGNGPSLADVIARRDTMLAGVDTLAVNFAANAPEYESLAPDYYLLADPHFEAGRSSADPNVVRLFERIDRLTSRPMTLFIPARWDASRLGLTNPLVKTARFNPVGIDGWRSFRHAAFSRGLGMPSPRNVLIPAIMTGIALGYETIYLVGADHSWTRTLSVSDDNIVQTVQPHFYDDNKEERERVSAVYRDVRLHDMMLSFHLAFKAYHVIASYAAARGVKIFNATPGSFIDAFERRPLPESPLT